MSKLTEDELKRYWLDFASRYCNRAFTEESMPYVIRLFLDRKVKSYRENPNVKAESLADLSKTYAENELSGEERELLNTDRSLRVPR